MAGEIDLRGRLDVATIEALNRVPALVQFEDAKVYQDGDNIVLSAKWDGAVKPLALVNPMLNIEYLVEPTVILATAMRMILTQLRIGIHPTPAQERGNASEEIKEEVKSVAGKIIKEIYLDKDVSEDLNLLTALIGKLKLSKG